jgi:hypothetical protein
MTAVNTPLPGGGVHNTFAMPSSQSQSQGHAHYQSQGISQSHQGVIPATPRTPSMLDTPSSQLHPRFVYPARGGPGPASCCLASVAPLLAT